MTIGEVLDKLSGVSDDIHVRFDFGGVAPTTINSWRGIYAEAAIGFSSGKYGDERSTVGALRKRLLDAIQPGTTYGGWKGGEYQYSKDTPLHVDNRGCYTNTELVRVQVQEWQVVLHTEFDDN